MAVIREHDTHAAELRQTEQEIAKLAVSSAAVDRWQ